MNQKLYLNFGGRTDLTDYRNQAGEQFTRQGFINISKVNILVGATNSGKSRFMREIIKNSESYTVLSLPSSLTTREKILEICDRLATEYFDILLRINPERFRKDPEPILNSFPYLEKFTADFKKGRIKDFRLRSLDFTRIKRYLEELFMRATAKQNRFDDLIEVYRFVLTKTQADTADLDWLSWEKREELNDDIQKDIKEVIDFLDTLPQQSTHKLPKPTYIPTLRTVVLFQGGQQNKPIEYGFLSLSVINNFRFDPTKVDVFTGNQLYQIIQHEQGSSNPVIHDQRERFQEFLSETFFEKFRVKLIPVADNEKDKNKNQLALLLDGKTMRLFHDLGDGIQAIIILMYKLFTAPDNSWIFIEEPEQGLHPGLQRIFLENLARHPFLQEKKHVIFMTTHSSHLSD